VRWRFDWFLGLWDVGQVSLSYDLASRGRLLIRDDELAVGVVTDEVVLGQTLSHHGKTESKRERRRKTKRLTSPAFTGLWPASFAWGYVDPRPELLLWPAFESTDKVHVFAFV